MSVLPVFFFGHGNPMNAISANGYTDAWNRIGRSLPRPAAILAVSAHWYVPATAVTAAAKPRTIHDFGGFPRELYEVEYPAPGSPDLAETVAELLAPVPVARDLRWGLDHGTWSVLCHVFPEADVPVVQLSLDETQPARYHYELGQRLAPLRDRGVLVVASGNVVHNLHSYAWGRATAEPLDWLVRFESKVRQLLLDGDDAALVDYENLGADAALSVPTPEHYLPLLYVLGMRQPGDPIGFPVEGVDGGSVSMLSVRIG
ncbi:MAG: 4,5-DOPA dioxygenase extradiol [Gammaproteobacteria bacterium]|nr:4,5-DOPA dioxygenase extradiol [Gammaproteobacteria bacterium]